MLNLPGIYTIIYEIVMYFIVTTFTIDVKFYINGKSGDITISYIMVYIPGKLSISSLNNNHICAYISHLLWAIKHH